jgi:hypothetical protein
VSEKRAPKRKRSVAGVPIEIVEAGTTRDNYIARADQVNADDWQLLKCLYEVRVTTRDRLTEFYDPIAYRYQALIDAGYPIEKLSPEELAARRRKAKREVSRAVTRLRAPSLKPPLGALGFIDVTSCRGKIDEDKIRAIQRSSAAQVKGRRHELITLSDEGLFYVKGRLGIASDAHPKYQAFKRAHSRLAHQLATSDILISLRAWEQVGVLDIVSFINEYVWISELTDGLPSTPESRRRRLLGTDIIITVAPAGIDDGSQDETFLVEVDCGNQLYRKPAKGQDPTISLPWKISNYFSLAKRLSKMPDERRGGIPSPAKSPLQLAFVVPDYARIKAATRAKRYIEMFEVERRDRAGHGGKDHELVTLMCAGSMTDPSPKNFAEFVALRMQARRQALKQTAKGTETKREIAPKRALEQGGAKQVAGQVEDADWQEVTR